MVPRERTLGLCLAIAWAFTACGHTAREPVSSIDRVEAGATPRIAADPYANFPPTVALRIDMRVDVANGDAPAERVELAPVRVTFELARDVHDRGAIQLRIRSVEVLDGGSDPQQAERLRADLTRQSPGGHLGWLRVGVRDNELAAIDLPQPGGVVANVVEVLAHIRQALQLLVVPLPTEPLGDGATWHARRTIDLRGMRLAQSLDATLRLPAEPASAGPVIQIAAELSGLPQQIELPDLPPGSHCEVVSARGTARGETHGPLGAVIGRHSRIELDLDTELRVHHAGEERTLRTQARITYTLAAVD